MVKSADHLTDERLGVFCDRLSFGNGFSDHPIVALIRRLFPSGVRMGVIDVCRLILQAIYQT